MKNYLSFLISFISVNYAIAATIHVPSEETTIQKALDQAQTNDVIIVAPGTYYENITWPLVQGIQLISSGDSSNTIIDGNSSGTVLTIDGYSWTGMILDSTTLVRGFTIQNGNLTGSRAYGTGVHIEDANPTFVSVIIKDNLAQGESYSMGAGVYADNSKATFRKCGFIDNIIETGTYSYGAGIYMDESKIKISNCIIKGNESNGDRCYGAGVHISSNSNVEITNTVIDENSIGDEGNYFFGAGVYAYEATVKLDRVKVINSEVGTGASYYYGAAIYCDGSDLEFTNILVANNMISETDASFTSAIVHIEDESKLTMMNSTIASNGTTSSTFTFGNGLYVEEATVNVINCILWNDNGDNEIEVRDRGNGSCTVSYSDIRGGWTGTGNINEDPLFVGEDDFHLSASSPCLNAGTSTNAPTRDIDNFTRPDIDGLSPDMGAYEMNSILTGIFSNSTKSNNIQFYPNPSTDYMRIQAEEINDLVDVKIYNQVGELVGEYINYDLSQLTLDKESIGKGIFTYTIQSNNTVLHQGRFNFL